MPALAHRVEVSSERCEGCGLCVDIVPEVFTVGPYPPASVIVDEIGLDQAPLLKRVFEAKTLCPTGAIIVDGPDE